MLMSTDALSTHQIRARTVIMMVIPVISHLPQWMLHSLLLQLHILRLGLLMHADLTYIVAVLDQT